MKDSGGISRQFILCLAVIALLHISGFSQRKGFDLNTTQLPPNYSGENLGALQREVAQAIAPKDEFETTPQYKARLRAALDRYTLQDVYAFKFHTNFKYDADSEVMKGTIYSQYSQEQGLTIFAASGAIVIAHGKFVDINLQIDQLKPERAREIKPNLAALLLCKLKPYKKADLSEPELIGIFNPNGGSFLYIQLESIWLYNDKTGEVYKKYKPGDLQK